MRVMNTNDQVLADTALAVDVAREDMLCAAELGYPAKVLVKCAADYRAACAAYDAARDQL